jgi:hypothetical protein
MLGTYFMPEYFRSIENPRVREPLMRMAQDIQEDLEGFEQILKSSGCEVIRAPQPTGVFDVSRTEVPPLQVRNNHCVIGSTLYQLCPDFSDSLTKVLTEYCPDVRDISESNRNFYINSMDKARDNYNPDLDIWYSQNKYSELAGSDWPKYDEYVLGQRSTQPDILGEMSKFATFWTYETKELGPLQGPNVINTTDRILVDNNEYCDYSQWLSQNISDHRPVQQFISKAAHVDGCFAVLGHNVILGIDPLIDYGYHFPEFRVIQVPADAYQNHISEFKLMKKTVSGAWWLPGQEHNAEFINFVELYLKSWTGYVTESIFDVNVLALNEDTICVSNLTSDVSQKLSAQGIDCIVVPWRHRFFVDGGLHCITLDLHRDL